MKNSKLYLIAIFALFMSACLKPKSEQVVQLEEMIEEGAQPDFHVHAAYFKEGQQDDLILYLSESLQSLGANCATCVFEIGIKATQQSFEKQGTASDSLFVLKVKVEVNDSIRMDLVIYNSGIIGIHTGSVRQVDQPMSDDELIWIASLKGDGTIVYQPSFTSNAGLLASREQEVYAGAMLFTEEGHLVGYVGVQEENAKESGAAVFSVIRVADEQR